MKLTKEIIRLFKYHGFMTVTAPDEDILKHYQVVEDLVNAGFVNDPEALRMAKMVFAEDGSPAVGPTKDEDVNTDEPIVETETPTPESEPEPEKIEEKVETETETEIETPTPESEQEKVNELVVETETPTQEPEKVEEKVEEQAEVKPKPKKTTTKKKSTEKES